MLIISAALSVVLTARKLLEFVSVAIDKNKRQNVDLWHQFQVLCLYAFASIFFLVTWVRLLQDTDVCC